MPDIIESMNNQMKLYWLSLCFITIFRVHRKLQLRDFSITLIKYVPHENEDMYIQKQ